MIRPNIINLLFCCIWLPLHAQLQSEVQGNFVSERIILHTDRTLYISGETIWFKTYVLDGRRRTLTDFSKVVYLQLVAPDGTVVSQLKGALKDGQSAGTIQLPAALPSGYYTLRAYTQALRNQGEQAFSRLRLVVLNPAQPLVRSAERASEPGETILRKPGGTPPVGRDLRIDITASAATCNQRGATTLEITTRDLTGRPVSAQLSLAVALPDPAEDSDGAFFSFGGAGTEANAVVERTSRYPAETEGMLVRGQVTDQGTGQGKANTDVYLSFPGRTSLVYLQETDEHGDFSFLLPKLYGLRPMVVQVRPPDQSGVQIQLAEAFHEVSEDTSGVFALPPAWEATARRALINAQVTEAYRAFAPTPAFAVQNPFDSVPFFGRPDKQYFLDDYTRFPLPEFFFEVTPEVRVKGKFGSEEVRLLNDWERQGEETQPLLLVDGVPVFDQRTFLKINNQLIKSVEVVTTPFWLNPVVFDGIIQLSSFEGDARCFELPKTALRRSFLGLLPERQFQVPDYESEPDRRLPDFRSTLYWNPSVQTDTQGKATVRFFASDDTGDYVIRVVGVSEEGGIGWRQSELRVVKKEKGSPR